MNSKQQKHLTTVPDLRKKSYEVFASKHPMNGELKAQGDKIQAIE